jgi:hypothetical protein
MAVWKVSYVVTGSDQAGGIINFNHNPVVGEILSIGETKLEIIEVLELIPPKRDFHYIHVTCRDIQQAK